MKKGRRNKILLTFLALLVLLISAGYICFNMTVEKQIRELYLEGLAIFADEGFVQDIRECETEEVYRFNWWRAFNNPVLITVYVNDDEGLLNLRVVGYEGGPKAGELIENKDIQLTKEKVKKLRRVVSGKKFWKAWILKFIVGPGPDGSGWDVEAKRKGRIYLDSRWSPQRGSTRKIGLYMIELSGLELKENEIY